jgi:hypothetical protein
VRKDRRRAQALANVRGHRARRRAKSVVAARSVRSSPPPNLSATRHGARGDWLPFRLAGKPTERLGHGDWCSTCRLQAGQTASRPSIAHQQAILCFCRAGASSVRLVRPPNLNSCKLHRCLQPNEAMGCCVRAAAGTLSRKRRGSPAPGTGRPPLQARHGCISSQRWHRARSMDVAVALACRHGGMNVGVEAASRAGRRRRAACIGFLSKVRPRQSEWRRQPLSRAKASSEAWHQRWERGAECAALDAAAARSSIASLQ